MKNGQVTAIEEGGDEIVADFGRDEQGCDADGRDATLDEGVNDAGVERSDGSVSCGDSEWRSCTVRQAVRSRFEMTEGSGTVHDDKTNWQGVQPHNGVHRRLEAARVDGVRLALDGERRAAELDDELDATWALLRSGDVGEIIGGGGGGGSFGRGCSGRGVGS